MPLVQDNPGEADPDAESDAGEDGGESGEGWVTMITMLMLTPQGLTVSYIQTPGK